MNNCDGPAGNPGHDHVGVVDCFHLKQAEVSGLTYQGYGKLPIEKNILKFKIVKKYQN